MRRTGTLAMVLLAMLVLASGVAFAAVLKGTPGDDEISGTTQNDTIYGYGGNDRLFGSPAGVTGSGTDNINGGPGSDTLNGELGADGIAADYGNDLIADGPVKDGMRDTISGGPGNDEIYTNNYPRATDSINCGTGIDTVVADSADTFVTGASCEQVRINNPTTANPPPVDPCPPDPTVPCEPDSRPRFR